MILFFSLFLFPLTYVYLLFEAGTFILHCFRSSVFFFFLSFPAKGIYPACDRVHLILSFYMNLRTYIGDSSLSEFLRKTLQCIRNETF